MRNRRSDDTNKLGLFFRLISYAGSAKRQRTTNALLSSGRNDEADVAGSARRRFRENAFVFRPRGRRKPKKTEREKGDVSVLLRNRGRA